MASLGAEPSPSRTPDAVTLRPVRALDRWSLTAVGISGIIGAGIYGLPGVVASSLGAYSVPAFIAAAALVLAFGYAMAVLSSRTEATGGPYVYVAAVFGPFWGFMVGWFFALARLTALGAVTNVFITYLARFVPACAAGFWRVAAIVACLGILAGINVAGIRQTASTMNAFAVGKILPLLAFAVAGIFFGDASRLSLGALPAGGEVGSAMLLLIFAFGGFEFLTVPAEESTRPTQQVPFALIASVVTSSILYIGVQATTVAAGVPDSGRGDALAHIAGEFAGSFGALAMAAGAAVATTGTNFANILVTSRMVYAFSRDGMLPGRLGTLHRTYRTPAVAIGLVAAVGILLAVSGSFAYLAAVSAAARLVTYGACAAAVVRLRARESRTLSGSAATTRAGKMVGLLSPRILIPAGSTVFALLLITMLPAREIVLAAVASASGVFVYLFRRKAAHAPPDAC